MRLTPTFPALLLALLMSACTENASHSPQPHTTQEPPQPALVLIDNSLLKVATSQCPDPHFTTYDDLDTLIRIAGHISREHREHAIYSAAIASHCRSRDYIAAERTIGDYIMRYHQGTYKITQDPPN